MPQTHPVPSKGALKVLRRIALGTSCTVAFGAGIISEDRRRRIHAARQVYENGKRIKASRQYHNAGSVALSTFEEDIATYGDKVSWRPPVTRSQKSNKTKEAVDIELKSNDVRVTDVEGSYTSHGATSLPPLPLFWSPNNDRLPIPKMSLNSSRSQTQLPRRSPQQSISYPDKQPVGPASTSAMNWQQGLAHDMDYILRKPRDRNTIDLAISRFFDSVDDVGRCTEHNKSVLVVCSKLSQLCQEHGRLDDYILVLKKILSIGPVDEEYFYSLGVPTASKHILHSAMKKLPVEPSLVDENAPGIEELKEATSFFLFPTRNKPATASIEMYQLGCQLCAANRGAKLYDVVGKVYFRMMYYRGEAEVVGTDHLIIASSEMGNHKKAIQLFRRLYTGRNQSAQEFLDVVTAVMKSVQCLGDLEVAEATLLKATTIAKENDFAFSTHWLLKLLGDHWRSARDLLKTEALFERLESCLDSGPCRQAAYSAMIQFCVESGNESAAYTYFDRLKEVVGPDTVDVRTIGHFVLAKAMKNDWQGVEEDLVMMQKDAVESHRVYGNLFQPILKLYAQSHSPIKTKKFVRRFIKKCGLKPNSHISNIVIHGYADKGDYESIWKWLDFMRKFRLGLDAASFNVVLTLLQGKFHLSFDELFRFCGKAAAIDEKIIDQKTLQILRSSAIQASKGNPSRASQLLSHINTFQCSTQKDSQNFVASRMKKEMALGAPHKALSLFKDALKHRTHLTPEIGTVAIEASLRVNKSSDDISLTLALVPDAILCGGDIGTIVASLLFRQLEILRRNNSDIESSFGRTITLLTNQGIDLSMKVATKVASILMNQGFACAGIKLWKMIFRHNNISSKSIDLHDLTVLMKAYTALSDLQGMDWVMRLLSQNQIYPDMRFKNVIKTARLKVRKHLEQHPYDSAAQMRSDFLDRALETVLAQRVQEGVIAKDIKVNALKRIDVRISSKAISGRQKLKSPVISLSSKARGSGESRVHASVQSKSRVIDFEDQDYSIPLVGVAAAG